jgi:tetratricopeptide (TPR) repeat protein
MHDLDKALADYSKAIELDPTFAAAWTNRGNVYYLHLDQLERAIADYSRAIELEPRYQAAWGNWGGAYRKLGGDSTVIGNTAPVGADVYNLGALTMADSTVGVIVS